MPTPFEEMNEHYKNRTGMFAPKPGPPKTKLDTAVQEAATKAVQSIVNGARSTSEALGRMNLGPQTQGPVINPPGGPAAQAVQAGVQEMSAAGRRATAPLRKFASEMAQGVGTMARGFDKAVFPREPQPVGTMPDLQRMNWPDGRSLAEKMNASGWMTGPKGDVGVTLNTPPPNDGRSFWQRINEGPKGDKPWLSFNQPNGGAQAAPPPAAVPDKMMPAHTPSKERNPAAAATGGDPGKGVPKPGMADTTGTPMKTGQPGQTGTNPVKIGSTGSKYLDDYFAGKRAEDMIHLIRGTKSTYANPKQTDKEFETPLEAKHGVSHYDAMAKFGIDTKAVTELEKEMIKANSDEKTTRIAADATVQAAGLKNAGDTWPDGLFPEETKPGAPHMQAVEPTEAERRGATKNLTNLLANTNLQSPDGKRLLAQFLGSFKNPAMREYLYQELRNKGY